MDYLNDPAFADLIHALLQLVIASAAGAAALIYRKIAGKDLDAEARATLHSALETGAYMAWSRFFGPEPVDQAEMMRVQLAHVLGAGAADAVKTLGIEQADLNGLAEAKLMKIGTQFQDKKVEGAA